MKIDKIEDPIAEDIWRYTNEEGNEIESKVIVGKPEKAIDKDWYCPVFIENFTSGVVTAYGVGPVDSLMNAMELVKNAFDKAFKDSDKKKE